MPTIGSGTWTVPIQLGRPAAGSPWAAALEDATVSGWNAGVSHLSVAFLAAAAVCLGRAIQINNGFYDEGALVWLSAALVCMLAVLVPSPRSREAPPSSRLLLRLPTVVLIAGLGWQFATLLTARPAMYIGFARPSDRPAFFTLLVAAALLSVLVAFGTQRIRRGAFVGALLVHFALGAWMIQASPRPRIDVVTVHRAALDALAEGRSPYSTTFENIYGHTGFYAPGATKGDRVLFGLPYPPLSLLMAVPGDLLGGDYRYSLAAAVTATGAFIGFGALRRRDRNASIGERQACLAALVLLFTPRVFFQIEQGWTEPFATLLLAATVAAGSAPSSAAVAGLFIAVKQYAIVAGPLLPLLWGGRWSWRRFGATAAVALAVTAPFFLQDPQGFNRSVVLLQFAEPFRHDSLSYLSWMVRNGSPRPEIWLTAAAAVLALGLAIWRLPRTPAGFATGVAFVSLASFAFGKKAFCNYYFFVVAALVTAVAAAQEHVHEPTSD